MAGDSGGLQSGHPAGRQRTVFAGQTRIHALQCQEFGMGALLDHPTKAEHDDMVCCVPKMRISRQPLMVSLAVWMICVWESIMRLASWRKRLPVSVASHPMIGVTTMNTLISSFITWAKAALLTP